jgi:predicted Zn-dependent protease
MVLPLPYKASVKREPSLYSVQRSIHPRQDHDNIGQVGDEDADAIIEQALLQRLQQSQNSGSNVPGQVMTNALAVEHIRALNVLAEQEQDKVKEEGEKATVKKRARHVQVQTLQWNQENTDKLNAVDDNVSASPIVDNESLLKRLEIAEQELKKERSTRQKLEATLMETTDHFEVLSGLAYMKLRELWEEKLHWESAYIDVKEQSWRDHQKVNNNEVTSSDEGLSLDESYLDETNMYLHYPQVR